MGNTTTLENKSKFKEMIDSFGLPRLIIAGFLLLLLIAAPIVGLDFATQITNIITRFSWNAVMVLAMVPMVHSGCGLNFGLPLGIVSGLLGATLSIELGFTGFASFLMAILIATPFALLFGGGYGWLLNKIKGGEMMIATYVGFSSVSFMCMMWLLLPYKHPTMIWGFAAKGLRTVVSLEGFYDKALANFLAIDLNKIGINLVIPTGTLLVFALLAFLMWAFLHTKTGTAMTAVGSNPAFRGHQRGQDALHLRDHVHLAGCRRHPRVRAGLRLRAAVHRPLLDGNARRGGYPDRRRVGEQGVHRQCYHRYDLVSGHRDHDPHRDELRLPDGYERGHPYRGVQRHDPLRPDQKDGKGALT